MPMRSHSQKVAIAIEGFLKAFEADPNINGDDKLLHLYNASALGSDNGKVGICYVSYQGRRFLPIEQAEAYLKWLQEGWVGTHFSFERGDGEKIAVKPYVEPKNEPVLVDEGVTGKRYAHPSWGTVGMSRVSGSAVLFGSNLRHHHFIRLSIGTAEKTIGDSGEEHIFGGMSKDLIEVDLSESQLGQLLSSMNMGSGVPCTIRYVNGDRRPECPVDQVTERFHQTIKTDVRALTEKLHTIEEEICDRFNDKKPLGQAERREILDKINQVFRVLEDKMPFVQKMFEEKLEEQVSAAKAEIDGFLAHKLQAMGAGAIQDRVAVLGEGIVKDTKPQLPDVYVCDGCGYDRGHGHAQNCPNRQLGGA